MILDEVVTHLKDDFTAWLVEQIILKLGLAKIMLIPVAGPILSVLLFKIAGIVAEKMDLGGYYAYKAVKNNAEASEYQDSIRETRKVTKAGDADAIAKARAIQRERFAKCMFLAS